MRSATSKATEDNAIVNWVSIDDRLSEGQISRSIERTKVKIHFCGFEISGKHRTRLLSVKSSECLCLGPYDSSFLGDGSS